jgi:ATP-dependent RNA helicase DDX52/ROK1
VDVRVVNVMRESGCDVPEWMLRLASEAKTQKKRDRRQRSEMQNADAPGKGVMNPDRFKKQPVQRKAISTTPNYDIKKRKHKQDMVEGTQRKKQKKEGGEASESRREEVEEEDDA